jgi:hypothetical protein
MSDVVAAACKPQLYCCSRNVLLDLKQKILSPWFTAYLILVLGVMFSCLYKYICMAQTCSRIVILVQTEILHLKWTHKQMAV